MVQERYQIKPYLVREALNYAKKSRAYTSDRHDFHEGGLSNKEKKMFEGKLGEKAFKMFLMENNIGFLEDSTSFKDRDEYDFLLCSASERYRVDVKTRTEDFHIRTLEMVEQAKSHPKDIYVSARLYKDENKVKLLGWFSFNDMIQKAKVENLGYLDNYVMYDKDLRPIEELEEKVLKNFKRRGAA